MRSVVLACIGLLAFGAKAAPQVVPGATWTAVRSLESNIWEKLTQSQTNTGQHIQAHGGGILKVGDKWYWYAHLHTSNLSNH